MPPKQRIAVTLPGGPHVQDSIDRVKWAEANGYDDAWFGDGGAPDALTTAGILAAHTDRLRIGVAVTPVYTRTPAVLAATANALGQALPGRFVMGLGASSQNMMDGWSGVKLEKPVTRVKETAIMVKSMLAGEKSDFDLETLNSHNYRQMPLEQPVPVYIAALRPKMIEMAAEIGDGVVFNLWPMGALEKMVEHVYIGAAKAGKKGEDVEIVNRHMVLVTDDKESAYARFRAGFAPYYATPVYNAFLAWAGYEEEAATIREGWAERDREKTGGAITDKLINEIGIIGTEEECRERLQWCAKTGIHTHIIAPLGGATPEETMRTFEAFTPDKLKL